MRFLRNALGIRSCESERRKQDWTEGEIEQQRILNGNLSQPMGSLNLGNRQGLYNHHSSFSLDVATLKEEMILSVEGLFSRGSPCRGLTAEVCVPATPPIVADPVLRF